MLNLIPCRTCGGIVRIQSAQPIVGRVIRKCPLCCGDSPKTVMELRRFVEPKLEGKA